MTYEMLRPVHADRRRCLSKSLFRITAPGQFSPSYGLHSRLSILGPLEARLLRPDVVVLGHE